jgi:plasmid stability protein
MTAITIRNVDDALKKRLRMRAAQHGISMEEEVRNILRAALCEDTGTPSKLGTAMHETFRRFGGIDLEVPPRERMRKPPRFD